MKLVSYLNNIFDQYHVEENRVTNAFLQTLANSKDLMRAFLNHNFNITTGAHTKVIISSQKIPLGLGDQEKEKVDSIPDGWIIVDENTAIVFETKIITDAIKEKQLIAHTKRIKNYENKFLCVITPDDRSPVKDIQVNNTTTKWLSWREILRLVNEVRKDNAVDEYFRNQLKEYLTMKDNLVGFQGVTYASKEYNLREAKFIIRNLIKDIKEEVLQIYPKLQYERKSYSQDVHKYSMYQSSTWSYLATDDDFTKDIHLTFWLTETHFGMGLTVPNGAKKKWQHLTKINEDEELFGRFVEKLLALRQALPNLYLEFVHRHYERRRDAIVDGLMEMNFDTVYGQKPVRVNKEWLLGLRELVKKKKDYNGQFMIRTKFFYEDHPEINNATFKNTVVKTAKSFKEIYDFIQ